MTILVSYTVRDSASHKIVSAQTERYTSVGVSDLGTSLEDFLSELRRHYPKYSYMTHIDGVWPISQY